MTFLPILRRELLVAARRTGTYRQRLLFAGLATAAVLGLFLYLPQTQFTGATIFHVVSWGGFVLCVLEGLRATADSIALERREGTLGLLLITGLNGRQIVVGKVAAACVQSVTIVVAMLPAFALPVLIGGVTVGECWRVGLTFMATLFFALTAGVLVSALATSSLTAFLAAFTSVVLWMGLPVALGRLPGVTVPAAFVWLGGPLEMFLSLSDASFTAQPWLFWLSAALSVGASLLMFTAAGVVLERRPQLEVQQEDSWWQRWLRPGTGRSESWGGASAKSNPAVWLAERTLPGQRVLWIVILIGAVICFGIGCFGGRSAIAMILLCEIFFAFFIKLWVAAVAPLSLNNSRRNGALELLLCTPLSPAELVRGQVDALYGYFIGPALLLATAYPMCGIAGLALGNSMAGMRDDPSLFGLGLFWLVLFILDLHALAYAGLWFGLTNARVDRAVTKTFFLVMILPWISWVLPPVGCIGVIGWPVFWINWAGGRLQKRFRDEAGTLFSVDQEPSGWLPWSRRGRPD